MSFSRLSGYWKRRVFHVIFNKIGFEWLPRSVKSREHGKHSTWRLNMNSWTSKCWVSHPINSNFLPPSFGAYRIDDVELDKLKNKLWNIEKNGSLQTALSTALSSSKWEPQINGDQFFTSTLQAVSKVLSRFSADEKWNIWLRDHIMERQAEIKTVE